MFNSYENHIMFSFCSFLTVIRRGLRWLDGTTRKERLNHDAKQNLIEIDDANL